MRNRRATPAITSRTTHHALLVALAVGLLAVMLVPSLPAPPSAAAPSGARQSATTPTLELKSQPVWVNPAAPTTVTVSIAGAPAGSKVRAQLHDRITSRFALHSNRPAEQTPVTCAHSTTVAGLDGATTGDATITIRITDKDKPQLTDGCPRGDGVYPLRVWVDDGSGHMLGSPLVTYLLLAATAPASSTATGTSGTTTSPAGTGTASTSNPSSNALGVALLLPLGDSPTIDSQGRRRLDTRTRATITNVVDVLQGPAGTYGTGAYPVTLAPSPDTFDSLAAVPQLRRDLQDVATARGRQVVPGPYIRVDQPALVRDARLSSLLDEELTTGQAALASLGTTDSLTDSTWIAGSDLDPVALTWLRARGIRRVLIPETATGVANDAPTATHAFKLRDDRSGAMRGVVMDSALSDELGDRDPRLGIQQVLADLTLIANQSRSTRDPSEGVVLAAPRHWSPSATTLRTLLDALAAAPAVLRPVTVNTLFSQSDDTSALGSARTLSGRPPSTTALRRAVDSADRSIESYQSVVAPSRSPGTATATAIRQLDALELRRRIGVYEGFDTATQRRYLGAIAKQVAQNLDQITIPGGQKVTLTARTAKVPFTIRNGTGVPVDVVVIAEGSERVKFESGQEQNVHIEGESARVDLKVHVRTSGDIPVRIRLLTPGGAEEITSARITVRSTVVSGVGLILTIGALAFLLIWWVSHWRSNRKPPKGRHARPRKGAAPRDLSNEPEPSQPAG